MWQSDASSGNVSMLRWLQQVDGESESIGVSTIIRAHEAGQQRVVRYLQRAGYDKSDCAEVCALAIKHADRDRLTWLREHGFPWSKIDLLTPVPSASLSFSSHIRLLPYLDSSILLEIPASPAACKHALHWCKSGHEEGCLCQLETAAAAAISADVVTFDWLLEHGCPWRDRFVYSSAAAGGSLYILQRVLSDSASLANSELLTWLLMLAVEADSLVAAQWLLQQGARGLL
jgi:hypothetical protein